MASFVGNDAFHLARIIGGHDQPCVEVNALPASDKCVQTRIVDDVEIDVCGHEACDLQNWIGPFTQGLFDFCVPNETLAQGGDCRA